MAINTQAEYEKLYRASQMKSESLLDRLNKIDQFNRQVDPVALAQITDSGNRPSGYDPLRSIDSAIQFSEASRYNLNAANQEYMRNQDDSRGILDKLDAIQSRGAAQSPFDKMMETIKLEAAKQQVKDGKFRLNLKTGELEEVGDGSDDPVGTAKTKISSLKPSEKNRITDVEKAVQELNKIKRLFAEVYPNGDPSDIGSLVTGTTGPLAQFLGPYTNNPKQKELRTEIGRVRDAIKKDTFGTAFTGTEKADATLMGKEKQEAENFRIVNSFLDSKVSELKRRLVAAGLSDTEADTYVQSLIQTSPTKPNQTSGKPKTKKDDPLGIL